MLLELPLRVSVAHIARPLGAASGSIEVATDTALMFGGSAAVTIPAGAEYVSDEWIRDPKHFDVVVDFDKVVRDPARPDRLNPAFDSGDHLHPSAVGYKAMGEAIPLTLFSSAR
jgi:lysophospholipase L1-like esterase